MRGRGYRRANSVTKKMDTQITDEQRKAFSDLIKEAEQKHQQQFENQLHILKEEITPRLEAKSKVKQWMDDIRILRAKLADAADGLRKHGFRVVDDGLISIDYDIDQDARRRFDQSIREAREDNERSHEEFRKAIFDVWSAKTTDEAREIVRRLI
jgi:hypothetical protein